MKIILDLTAIENPTGVVMLLDDQRYTATGTVPHQRIDGTSSRLILWQTHCPECGVPFTVQTPLTIRSELTRRCPEHRKPGRRVTTSATAGFA